MPLPEPSGIVTLTTDFGLDDHYVGVMKGVIASIAPQARTVDVTHQVRPYAIEQGAFFLSRSYRWFPPGTVHLAVVDPGVGTSRRALAVFADGHYFVGPDNGLLPAALGDLSALVFAIDEARWGLHPLSATFHGRDLFAPAAAWLARGKSLTQMGEPVKDWVRSEPLKGVRVVSIDRFGNVVTSLRPEELTAGTALVCGGVRVSGMARTYQEAPAGAPFLIVGSSELVEISVRRGSAAKRLGLSVGDELSVGAAGRPPKTR